MQAQDAAVVGAHESDNSLRFVARQPILDTHENIYGYELLFRRSAGHTFCGVNNSAASLTTIDSSLLLGAGSLTGGHKAFVNCTRDLLISGLVTLLPRDIAILEVLEDVEPDDDVLAACRRLKKQGYTLAMDDFTMAHQDSPLLQFVDILKVDLSLTSPEERMAIAQHWGRRGLTMLAEKVETREQFEAAVDAGFRFFQGYFFCRPVTLSTRDIPSQQQNFLRLLHASQDPNLDLSDLERIIRQEVSLCYRLLRYLNSAAFGLYPVRSIGHALVLLGEREIRKWMALVTTAALAAEKPPELIRTALLRARFCELSVAPRTRSEDLFLLGLFSLLDAMLDRPMAALISDLPISQECKTALLGGGNSLRKVLDTCILCETTTVQDGATPATVDSAAWDRFAEAGAWAHKVGTSAD